jgi:hypothetical protein
VDDMSMLPAPRFPWLDSSLLVVRASTQLWDGIDQQILQLRKEITGEGDDTGICAPQVYR